MGYQSQQYLPIKAWGFIRRLQQYGGDTVYGHVLTLTLQDYGYA